MLLVNDKCHPQGQTIFILWYSWVSLVSSNHNSVETPPGELYSCNLSALTELPWSGSGSDFRDQKRLEALKQLKINNELHNCYCELRELAGKWTWGYFFINSQETFPQAIWLWVSKCKRHIHSLWPTNSTPGIFFFLIISLLKIEYFRMIQNWKILIKSHS